MAQPKRVRVWGRGQFTIPAEFRERLNIAEESYLEVYQVGKAIIAVPERLAVDRLAEQAQKEMREKGLTLKDLLAELREGEHDYEIED